MQTAVGQTVALGLRQPASTQPHSLRPPVLNNAQTNLASQQSCFDTEGLQKACVAQDDFDDWDVDLADLDECDPQMGVGGHLPQPVQPPAPFPVAPTTETGLLSKKLRPPACGGTQTLPGRGLRELSTPCHTPGLSARNVPPPTSTSLPAPSPAPRPVCFSAPAQSPGVFPGLTATSHISSPFPRPVRESQQPQRPCTTPAPSPQGRSLFGSISPASSSVTCPGLSPRPIHTPVLTNHLVQLVSASSKLPRKRPRPAPQQPRTRRFPGPAGLLPQQPQGQSLDDIVVSVPQTPAHGAVARLPNQPPSSQTEEDEFSGGPWAVMKAEMGLDERNPSCFLHSYSVVMVLRKAALKQLAKNKVPNMAVLLKSIVHTYTDAKAVFKDPTGEIQGTVHRRLLEDRLGELKPGAVLLLKQVGVFSPSHRNHYLNVTPNNLLRIYPPDGVSLSSTQLPPLALVSDMPKNRKTRLHFAKNEICHLEMFYQAVNCPLKMLFLSPMMEHQGGDYDWGFSDRHVKFLSPCCFG
uniref:Homologous recombination factor with OB-fold n=1 Tax=Myripristis murdjan TaxID=586833 RepID=A0A667Z2Q1_9TELE